MHCNGLHPNCIFPFVHPLGTPARVMQQPLSVVTLLLHGHNLHKVNHGQPFRRIHSSRVFSHRLARLSVVAAVAKNPTHNMTSLHEWFCAQGNGAATHMQKHILSEYETLRSR
jgi:hypothetical protein